MLGGGGIARLVGLFTLFILAFALGGGIGVPLGVSTEVFSSSSLGAAALSKAGGTGGGGRRWGLVRLSIPVVRLFGVPLNLLEGPDSDTFCRDLVGVGPIVLLFETLGGFFFSNCFGVSTGFNNGVTSVFLELKAGLWDMSAATGSTSSGSTGGTFMLGLVTAGGGGASRLRAVEGAD